MTKSVMPVSSARRRGFTLTEIAIVLGIIGIILGAIWAAAAMVYENNRTKEAREQTLTIINNWRSIYGSRKVDLGGSSGGSGADITALTVNNGFAPPEMINPDMTQATGCNFPSVAANTATCAISGPWSGSVVSVLADQVDNGITIKFSDINSTACNHIANSLADAASLLQLNVGGATVSYPPLGTASTPMTASTISGGCTATGNTNSVIAEFGMN